MSIPSALEHGLRLYTARLAESLTSSGSVASGDLGESITINVLRRRRGVYTGQILMLDYWEAVDQGRSAGKPPPVQSILDWLAYPNVQSRMTFGRENEFNFDRMESIAYAIAKKIGDKGTKGNDFATNVFESDLSRDMQDALVDAVAYDFDNTIDELNALMNN